MDDLRHGLRRRGNESRYTFDWKYTAGTARPGLTVARLGAP